MCGLQYCRYFISNMETYDRELAELVEWIIAGNSTRFSRQLEKSPVLARVSFESGASRDTEKPYYFEAIARYLWSGDTALHFAAAAYRRQMAKELIDAGADIRAKNRLGDEPLHAAAVGVPGAKAWNPDAQSETVAFLIDAGADPNARNKNGVTPLHRAVRTRCAAAVRVLLQKGADPAIRNKSGSNAMRLAIQSTGRGGTGSPEAKSQQREILNLLHQR